jgi:predicted SAM-dependent methyltransferase
VVHDLLKPLPFPASSVSCIYAGEVWEHFEYSDAARLTADCYRVLAPGGVLRLRVPDGAAYWRRYIELFDEMMKKPKPERSAGPVRDHLKWFFNDICTHRSLFKSMGHYHKWQFDELQLVDLLESSGFSHVSRRGFHESRIPDVHLVEKCTYLIVEGLKPSSAHIGPHHLGPTGTQG